MSNHEKDGLLDCLFSRQDRKLVNIKFMRGSAEIIAPEDLRAEVCSVLSQRDKGLEAIGPIKSGRSPLDIRRLVADL